MSDPFYDQAFAQIAQRTGNIQKLLDEFFFFLNKRTDFYVEFDAKDIDSKKYKMGFLKGAAESMVLTSMKKYPFQSYESIVDNTTITAAPSAIKSNSIQSPTELDILKDGSLNTMKPETIEKKTLQPKLNENGKQIPMGNGGIADNYIWSQTFKDISVYIEVPKGTKGKDISCSIKPSSISLKRNNVVLLEGLFEENVNSSDSIWTIQHGKDSESSLLIITLEKIRENWWKSVVIGHPEIDTTKVSSNFYVLFVLL